VRTWIKLYTEVLHDPKMHALTDRQFRACINLFALAGYTDKDGCIGTFEDIRFHLRLSRRDTESTIKRLETVGIVQFDEPNYTVTAFSKRNGQSPSQSNVNVLQRVHAYRARKQGESEIRNEDVTTLHSERNEDVTTLDKNRIDKNIADAKKPRQPDPLFDAIAKVTCTDPATAGPSIGKVESVLKKASPPYTSEEVLKFGNDWPQWKDKPPTLWQLKEQIGAVRQNGNGAHKEPEQPSPRKVYR
jgi:hypothetical protein